MGDERGCQDWLMRLSWWEGEGDGWVGWLVGLAIMREEKRETGELVLERVRERVGLLHTSAFRCLYDKNENENENRMNLSLQMETRERVP